MLHEAANVFDSFARWFIDVRRANFKLVAGLFQELAAAPGGTGQNQATRLAFCHWDKTSSTCGHNLAAVRRASADSSGPPTKIAVPPKRRWASFVKAAKWGLGQRLVIQRAPTPSISQGLGKRLNSASAH